MFVKGSSTIVGLNQYMVLFGDKNIPGHCHYNLLHLCKHEASMSCPERSTFIMLNSISLHKLMKIIRKSSFNTECLFSCEEDKETVYKGPKLALDILAAYLVNVSPYCVVLFLYLFIFVFSYIN